MELQENGPRKILEMEYLARRKKNPGYSLRAFARLLDLPSGRVSQLLSQKRRFTPKVGKKIALRLNYDPQKSNELLASIQTSRAAKSTDSKIVASLDSLYQPIDMDVFQSISDPIHFAFLSLVETSDFQSDFKFIASRLGISTIEARHISERLIRIGLLKLDKKGNLALLRNPGLTTSHDIQSAAVRESHKKALQHSLDSIDTIAVELRDITSMTMAIDPKRIPEAKKKLRAIRRSLSEFLESGKRSEVYRLNIQLVPVTKKGKNK